MELHEDLITLTGHVLLRLLREDGSEETEVSNLVVTAGKGWIAARMGTSPPAAIGWAAVGTSATAAAAGDTTLGAEIGGSRTALAGPGTAVAGAVVTYNTSLGPGIGTGALVEAGLFNASSAGTMLARTTFAVINKAAGDTLQITWNVTVG